jgi:outer membrane lipoprotein-sorting protein
VSIHAVKFHVSNMLSKLGLVSRQELAAWRPARGPRLAGARALVGAMHLGSMGARLVAGLVIAGVGLAGAAVVIASLAGGDDESTADAAAQRTATPTAGIDAVPDITPTLKVTSFQLTQREVFDVRLPGGPQTPTLEQLRTVSYRDPDATAEQTVQFAPNQQTRFSVVRDATRWMWGPDLPRLMEMRFASTAMAGMAPMETWQVPSLRSEVATLAQAGREVTLVERTTASGRQAILVRLSADQCLTDPALDDVTGELSVWFDRETLFILRYEVRSRADGRVTQLREVTQISYNPLLADSIFEVPTDRQVMVADNTKLGAGQVTLQQATAAATAGEPGVCPTPQDSAAFMTPNDSLSVFVTATPLP